MTRPWAAVLTAIALCAGCRRPAPQRLVLITIDTLRADHVGAARDGIVLTPQLDRFAKDAIRYSDAVANASMTVPSHASLLTGLLPFRHGALTNDQAIAKDVPTLAEALQARGFYTGAIVSSVPLSPHSGLDRGFRSYGSKFDSAELNRERQLVKTPEATTHAALGFLRRHADVPFFLWLHYFPPHGPYMPASEYLQGLPEAAPDPARRLPISAKNFEVGSIPAYQRYRDETDPEAYRRRYAGAVREVDQHVGRVLEALRDAGMYDAATIVITSDHGESLGEHDWYFNHANLVYAEQVQIPLLLKLPGRREAGRVVTDPVEAVDLVPTLLQSLGFPGTLAADGRVVLPEALSGPAPPRFTQSHSGELAAVIDGGHKLVLRFPRELSFIQSGYPQRELFDLASDPGETKDTSQSDPATVARLEALLRAHQSAYVKRTGPPGVDEEALRALGYVQ